MPDYVPIQDLTIAGSISDNDMFPMSDGSGAYAVRGSTIKSYAAADAAAAAADAELSKTAAQNAATAAGNAQTIAEGAATTAGQAIATANAAVATANNAEAVVNSAMSISGSSVNLIDQTHLLEATGWTESDGVYTGTVGAFVSAFGSSAGGYPGTSKVPYQPNMSYTFSVWVKCNEESLTGSNGIAFYLVYTDGTYITVGASRDKTEWTQIKGTTSSSKTLYRVSCGSASTHYYSDQWSIKEMQLVAGPNIPYVPYRASAIDLVERGLQATGDTTDRAPEIMSALLHYRYCELGAGDFYISNVVMPDDTILSGKGNATRIYQLDSATGIAISMKSKCCVSNVCIYGSTDDTYDETDNTGMFPGSENKDFTGETNLWGDGNQSITDTGFKTLVLTNSLPAGSYYIGVDSLTNTNPDSASALIYFSTSQTGSIPSQSIIARVGVPKGSDTGIYFDLPETAYSVRLYSAGIGESSGYTGEWSGVHIYSVASRHGIGWVQGDGETLSAGSISGCRIERFSGAGILGMDTGTPIGRGLTITDCFIRYCNVGVYFRKDCEFNKVIGCTMTRCYFGILNRGGNNNFTGCVISGNYINAQQDMDEGSNNGHGMINGCIMHHSGYSANDNYTVVIRDTGRIGLTCCRLSDKVLLKNTNGNTVTGNGFGDTVLEVVDGDCSLISNNMFRTVTATRINNTAAVLSDCYLRSGTPVTWSE